MKIGTLLRLARRFRFAETGVAAVEFALILPIMLLVYVGCMEASTLISMDRKVQSVSGAVGDLVARSDGQLTVATLRDYLSVAGGIMTPYDSSDLVQMISSVEVLSNGTTRVDWSRRYEHQTLQSSGGHTVNASFALPQEIIDVARGTYVIVAESGYEYLPLYGIVFDQPINLYRENFYLPRFGERIQLKP